MSVDIEQVFSDTLDAKTKKSVVSEATDTTAPAGSYKMDLFRKVWEEAGEKSPWPGRLLARIGVKLTNKKTGNGAGTLFFDASPIEIRNDRGALDGPAKNWGSIVAFTGKDLSNREVFESLGLFPFQGYVTRSYKTPEGWRTPKNEKEEEALKDAGYEARNFVQNLGAYKE